MGDFTLTCIASGLGIDSGDSVRCLLLTESPYGDKWLLRTLPIRARYNGYGAIKDIHPEDLPITEMWLRGFREDLVEKGQGDNQYHDVSVSKNMSFDQLLEALEKERVYVKQDTVNFWRSPLKDDDTPVFSTPIPGRQGITDLLQAHGHDVSVSATNGHFVVDEPVPHLVRVRFGRYEHGETHISALDLAKTTVENAGYVGVVVAGSGRYADDADLLVFPKPDPANHVRGPQWDMAPGQSADNKKLLRVRLAVIREDVWQAVTGYLHHDYVHLNCQTCGQSPVYHAKGLVCPDRSVNNKPYTPHPKGTRYSHVPVFPPDVRHVLVKKDWRELVWYDLDAFKWGVRKVWNALLDRSRPRKNNPNIGDLMFLSNLTAADYNTPGAHLFCLHTPSVIGIPEHFSMMLSEGKEVTEHVLDVTAELVAVDLALFQARVPWRPVTSFGPQYPEWEHHVRFAKTVLDIAIARDSEGVEDRVKLPATWNDLDRSE